MLLYL